MHSHELLTCDGGPALIFLLNPTSPQKKPKGGHINVNVLFVYSADIFNPVSLLVRGEVLSPVSLLKGTVWKKKKKLWLFHNRADHYAIKLCMKYCFFWAPLMSLHF